MSAAFDPYYTWLGIPPEEQPADYYRLLGITRFEENREVISNAADQRIAHIRSFQNGPSAAESQQLLNELSKAIGCLLNPRRKMMYDQYLKSSDNATRNERSLRPPTAVPSPVIKLLAASTSPPFNPPARRSARASNRLGLTLLGVGLMAIVGFAVFWRPLDRAGPAESHRPKPSAVAPTVKDPPSVARGPERAALQTSDAARSGPTVAFGPEPLSSPAISTAPRTDLTELISNEPAPPVLSRSGPKALQFRGNDWVALENTAGLIDLRHPFTVELWVRFAPEKESHWLTGDLIIGPNHPAVSGNSIAGWQFFVQQTENDRHRIAFSTRDGYASDFPVAENGWHHLAACSDSRRLSLFVDGRRLAAGEVRRLSDSFTASPQPIHLGGHGYLHASQPPGLTGDLRAFRISSNCRYAVDFQAAEILAEDEETQVLLDFANSIGDTVIDVSGHNRHGVVHGARWIEIAPPVSLTLAAAIPAARSESTAGILAAAPEAALSAPAAEKATAEPVNSIPAEALLIKARSQVRKVLEQDFKQAREPKDLMALANKLMRLAAESSEDLPGRFVMFEEANRLAIQAGELPKSLSMIDDFARRFAIDVPKMKSTAVAKSGDAAKTSADRRRLAEIAIALLDELIVGGSFDEAAEVAQVAVAAATRVKDADIGKVAREYREQITQAKRHLAQAREAKKRLDAAPDDGESQLGWGRFVCFHQHNWAAGLPHLARGSHPRLAAVAAEDLASPADAEQQLAIGRSWAALVKSVELAERDAVLRRALHWLRRAEAPLKGLAKANVEKTIKELEMGLPVRHRLAAANASKPPAGPPFEPLPALLGMPGRIQVNGVDIGVMWKYEGGLRLTNANVVSVLTQVSIPRGQLRAEFTGLIYLPESMTVNIVQTGGSVTGTAALLIDNKPLGEVGRLRATSDIYKIELNAGEHMVRWVLAGDDLGVSSLVFTNAATAKPLALYHSPSLLAMVRDTPTRARLNVNMSRN